MPDDDSSDLYVVRRGPRTEPAPGRLPVLLVHGSMDRASSFGRVQAHLADVATIAYDRRGYTHSSTRPPSEHFEDQVDDLLEVIGGQPVVALGHSFGGGIVLAAAARRPDLVRGAVVFEPPMPWLAWWPSHSAGVRAGDGGDPGEVAEAFVRRLVGDTIWEHLPAATRAARRAEGPALIAEMRSLREPGPWDPAAVTVPVVVGTGSESRPHHLRATTDLVAALPHGHLVVVEGSQHGAHLSHAAELAHLVRGLAASLEPAVGNPVPGGAESGVPPDQEEST